MTALTVYTDGGCSGNPGPGAWAYVVIDDENPAIVNKAYGSEAYTTNNRMELLAVIKALESSSIKLAGSRLITVYTDSQYVQKGISSWIVNWKANGWRTSSKEPVKNKDLWLRLDEVKQKAKIDWCWVKGHAGHEFNELCDRLTQTGIAEQSARLKAGNEL